MDTVSGDKSPSVRRQSTVSRFACRIVVDRLNPKNVRIYAAAFDSSRKIILGEKAPKWEEEGGRAVDGLTTNGVLLAQPKGPFRGGQVQYSLWREVSVEGRIFSLRCSRSAPQRGEMENEENLLRDGSLIDLCGATLLWRTAEEYEHCPSTEELKAQVQILNRKLECQVKTPRAVDPITLFIACKKERGGAAEVRGQRLEAWVNFACGHVMGCPGKMLSETKCSTHRCDTCLKIGTVTKLCLGLEPAFYVDVGPPMFAFNPCGHMATEKTVKFWASVPIPHGTNGFDGFCPFCATPLCGYPGYVQLVFENDT